MKIAGKEPTERLKDIIAFNRKLVETESGTVLLAEYVLSEAALKSAMEEIAEKAPETKDSPEDFGAHNVQTKLAREVRKISAVERAKKFLGTHWKEFVGKLFGKINEVAKSILFPGS